MKIIQIDNNTKFAQNSEIGQKQMQATNSAISFLKGKIPEIVPILSNSNTRSFLVKLFDLIASDPSVMNGFRNSLQAINSAMESDAAGTSVSMASN